VNLTKDLNYGYKISRAKSLLGRLVGLIGTTELDRGRGLYIFPCKGIHTFGMRYPVDVVFLDAMGMVIRLVRNLAPNRMTWFVPSAESVLEFPESTIEESNIKVGDQLQVEPDEEHRAELEGLKRIMHWPVNILIGLLWGVFVWSSYLHWQQSGKLLSLGLVFVNTLLVFLFLTRRQSTDMSHRAPDWIVALSTVGCSMLLRASPVSNTTVTTASVAVQLIGVIAILCSLLCLGRSFGIVPANRGVKSGGLYRLVRHPLYASEILFYFAFLLGNGSSHNVILVILIFTGQMYRSASEEQLLGKERSYREYMRLVPYRLLPGIY
jgi:protein-S-isoprenylcysteine O-methyltransferase Ste14/uncharacterized membrane protein (UPF0127 family)